MSKVWVNVIGVVKHGITLISKKLYILKKPIEPLFSLV